jgi:SAM-dependent methyltransferase
MRSKLAYYDHRDVSRQLAKRYYRAFGSARTILDLGCGTGTFGRYGPAGVTVHGVDADAAAVAAAAEFERAVRVDVETEPLPYPDGTFDGVLAKDIFEHVSDAGRLAHEVARVLRPGGIVVASVVMAKPARVWADYTHVRGFTRRSAELLLRDAGLTVEDVWRMGPVPGARRLGLVPIVPHLLRVPIFDWLWASSWELIARKAR